MLRAYRCIPLTSLALSFLLSSCLVETQGQRYYYLLSTVANKEGEDCLAVRDSSLYFELFGDYYF